MDGWMDGRKEGIMDRLIIHVYKLHNLSKRRVDTELR